MRSDGSFFWAPKSVPGRDLRKLDDLGMRREQRVRDESRVRIFGGRLLRAGELPAIGGGNFGGICSRCPFKTEYVLYRFCNTSIDFRSTRYPKIKAGFVVPLSIKWPPGHFMLDFPIGHILVYWVAHSRLVGFALRAGCESSHCSKCRLKKTGPFGPVFIFGGGLVRFRCAESL